MWFYWINVDARGQSIWYDINYACYIGQFAPLISIGVPIITMILYQMMNGQLIMFMVGIMDHVILAPFKDMDLWK